MIPRGAVAILCVVAAMSGPLQPPPPVSTGTEAPVPDETRVPRPLPFFYDLLTFRTEEGGTSVVAAIAVSAGRLRYERRDSRVRYRFDVRFVVADTARHSVYRTDDSVFVSTARPLAGGHLLHTFVEIEAPPSNATLQRVVVTDAARPGVGQLYRSPFPVPDYSGDELMISDLAFGLPGADAGWSRRGVTLALLPTSQFPESAFDLYYEVYNLPAGRPYDTEISIEPLDGSGQDRLVRTVFSDESSAGPDDTLGELRRVESALRRGKYRLTVTVTDKGSGQVASSAREVHVRRWGRGATLVRAIPRRDTAPPEPADTSSASGHP